MKKYKRKFAGINRQVSGFLILIPQYRHTEGQGRRRLLTPDEVLRLPNEELLCIIRGHNVLKLKKLDFTKHPMAKNIVRISAADYLPSPAHSVHTETASEEYGAEYSGEKWDKHEQRRNTGRTKPLYGSAKPPSEF